MNVKVGYVYKRNHTEPMARSVAISLAVLAGSIPLFGCKDPKPKVTKEPEVYQPNPYGSSPSPTPTQTPPDPRCEDPANYVCNVPQDLIDVCISSASDDSISCTNAVWTKRLYDQMVAVQTGGEDPELTDCPRPTLYVNTSADPLNLRDAPKGGAESSILTAISRGQEVVCLGKVKSDPAWTKVTAEGMDGYMASQYLTTSPPPALAGPSGGGNTAPDQGSDPGTRDETKGYCYEVKTTAKVEGHSATTCEGKNYDPVGYFGGMGIGGNGLFFVNCVVNTNKSAILGQNCLCDQAAREIKTKSECEYNWSPIF
jgi:hypothetical protein